MGLFKKKKEAESERVDPPEKKTLEGLVISVDGNEVRWDEFLPVYISGGIRMGCGRVFGFMFETSGESLSVKLYRGTGAHDDFTDGALENLKSRLVCAKDKRVKIRLRIEDYTSYCKHLSSLDRYFYVYSFEQCIQEL